MRILYHHRTLADGAEGVHIAAMVGAFRELGHEVRVIGMAAGGSTDRPSWHSRVKRRLPAPLFELTAMAVNLAEYRAVSREIRAFKPDFLYKRHARFDVGALAAASREQVPSVLEVNCLFSQPPYVRFEPMTFGGVARTLERRALRLASTVITVSSPLARLAGHLSDVRALVVPNGADTSRFDPASANPQRVRASYDFADRTVIGWVGVLREWHGLELLLEAVAALPDTHLLVVGDGPDRLQVEATARSTGIADRFTVTGRIPHAEMPDYIAAMDVAVVADERTGVASPMKLLEYMAMGKPVIAPAADNIRDVVADGIHGLLFAPGDSRALAGALDALVKDPGLRTRLGSHARDRIARERTWLSIARLVIDRVSDYSAPV